MRILFVDDDPSVGASMLSLLDANGFDVVEGAARGLELFRRTRHAMVILSLREPGPDSEKLAACNEIRNVSPDVRILVVGRDSFEERISAIEAGADDYLVGPCDPRELLARAVAFGKRFGSQVRRAVRSSSPPVTSSALDAETGSVAGPRGQACLTKIEVHLFCELRDSASRGISTETLSERILARHDMYASNLVHRHVCNLRRKLQEIGFANPIRRAGRGYVLAAAHEPDGETHTAGDDASDACAPDDTLERGRRAS